METSKANGLLQIALYFSNNEMYVHIIQGKQLQSSCGTNIHCNSLVRIALLPDPSDVTSQRTQIISNSNNPIYDEKFVYGVRQLGNYQRLYISSWHIPKGFVDFEFLGCMSFGLKNVISENKFINGWYYLLIDKMGCKKHLKMSSVTWGKIRCKSQPNIYNSYKESSDKEDKSSATTSGSSNPDNLWSDLYTLIILRGLDGGFGFTLTGSRPAKVCKIESNSNAESAGLNKQDEIIKVNGLDVNYNTTQEVADYIRSWKHSRLTLEVKRSYKVIVDSPVKMGISNSHTSFDNSKKEGIYSLNNAHSKSSCALHTYRNNATVKKLAHKNRSMTNLSIKLNRNNSSCNVNSITSTSVTDFSEKHKSNRFKDLAKAIRCKLKL